MDTDQIAKASPWIPAWHDTGASMDRRHILWIYELLVRLKPQRTLEIGSYYGCSSSAFIAAGVPDAHFADITVTQRMQDVIGDKGTIHQRKGSDVLRDSEPFDVVLLDGAHDIASVREEWEAMQGKLPRILILHDSWSKEAGFQHCEGPSWLIEDVLDKEWDGDSDMEKREGEMTHRGLTILTREPALRDVILEAMIAAQCL